MTRILYFNDEAHKYTDDLNNNYLSTTTLLGQYEPEFNTKSEARRLARSGKGIYKGKSAKQIETMWKNSTEMACDKGSVTHDELEDGVKQISKFNDAVKYLRNYDPSRQDRLFTIDDVMSMDNLKPVDPKLFYDKVGYKYPIIQQTVQYYCDLGWLLFAEVGVYDEKRLISGMIDLWAYNPKDNTFVIIDWKTNKDDITFESYYYKRDHEGQTTNVKVVKKGDYLDYPIDNLYNCKGYKYAMQLSVYAKLCEQRGLKCLGAIIFHIRDQYRPNRYGMPWRDENNNYVVDAAKGKSVTSIIMPYLSREVDRVFDDHMKRNHGEGIQYSMFK